MIVLCCIRRRVMLAQSVAGDRPHRRCSLTRRVRSATSVSLDSRCKRVGPVGGNATFKWDGRVPRIEHRWSSGRTLASQANSPGSIPGRCIPVASNSRAAGIPRELNPISRAQRTVRGASDASTSIASGEAASSERARLIPVQFPDGVFLERSERKHQTELNATSRAQRVKRASTSGSGSTPGRYVSRSCPVRRATNLNTMSLGPLRRCSPDRVPKSRCR